jgi:hypothetical protein
MPPETKERPEPFGQREIIMEMVYELVESTLPEDNKAMTLDMERRVDVIHHALSYALQIPVEHR